MPAMRRHVLACALLISAPVFAQAQDHGLRSKISDLFIFGSGQDPLFLAGSGDAGNNVFVREHGAHFIPSSSSANGSIIGFLIAAIGGNVANVPIGATSGTESFKFVGGIPTKTSTSAGPVFAERAQTIGRGKSLVGVGRSTLNFSTMRGIPLDAIALTFTHENVNGPGCSAQNGADCAQMGVPVFENDLINLNLKLTLNFDVTTLYMTYGIFDRMDVSLVLPVIKASMTGRSDAQVVPFGTPAVHYFSGTLTNPVLSASRDEVGSAFGLGDVAVRSKLLVSESPGASLALLAEARFPTGDENDLLGSGKFAARGLAILSGKVGELSPHVNMGYLYRAGTKQNGAVLATGGFDAQIAPGVTFAADVLSELQVGHSKLSLPEPVLIVAPYKRTIIPTNIPDMRDDVISGSFGFKFVTGSGVTIVTNALIPLNRGGLRSNVIYTGAVEHSF